MSLVRRIAAIPKPLLTILGLVSVAALWVLDYVTGPELSPLVFYVVPVVLVVWFGGRRPGTLVSIVAAFAWFLADFLTGRHEHTPPAILYWNGVEKLLFFLLLVQLLATLKAALERERHARQEFLERELRIAEQVQERLFPQRAPRLETLECAGVCRPARGVGGDYYDFLPLEDGRMGLAVGDVSGKGLSAALLMASLQGSLRSLASADGARVDEIVGDVNRQLCSLTESNSLRDALLRNLRRSPARAFLCQRRAQRADAPAGRQRRRAARAPPVRRHGPGILSGGGMEGAVAPPRAG